MKKKILPWMYVLSKGCTGDPDAFLVTIGDPALPGSAMKRILRSVEDLRRWVADWVGGRLPHNYVVDTTGLGLVPAEWDEEFLSNYTEEQLKSFRRPVELDCRRRKDLEIQAALERLDVDDCRPRMDTPEPEDTL